MITLHFDINRMTAQQLAVLDAAITQIKQTPSKLRNEIINAGHANCGAVEYESTYIKISNAIHEATK